MRPGNILLLLSVLLTYPFCLKAQHYPFVSYTPKDGLVSTRARHMFQDSKGKLYITTFAGLSVFDGARFTNYTTDNGLADNLVNDVFEMGEDSVWIMPNANRIQSLVRGRISDVRLKGFCPVINKLLKSRSGILYAFTDDGLFRLEHDRFIPIPLTDAAGRPVNRYFSKGCEIGGKLFIVTDPSIGFYPSPSYLIVYDPVTRKTLVSSKPPDVYTVAEIRENNILVGTNAGIKAIDQEALQQGRIELIEPPAQYMNVAAVVAHYFYVDRQQNVWMAGRNGIHRVDNQGGHTFFSTGNGLPVNIHFSLFQDREHTMWMMNEQTGITKLSNAQFEFFTQVQPGFIASDLYADTRSDTVWLIDNIHQNILQLYPGGQKKLPIDHPAKWLYKLIPGRDTHFLMGDFEVFRFDASANTVRPRPVYSYRDSMYGVGMVNYPLPDPQGNLLFSNNKINVAFADGEVVSYPLGYFGDQFVLGPHNTLWIGTRADKLLLFRLHPDNRSNYFELLKEFDKVVPGGQRSVGLDKEGNLWIGTRDKGLYCFAVDKQLNLSLKQHLTVKSGLSDNFMVSLHGDEEGNIWACSPVGLDKIQWKNNRWIVENITRSSNIYQKVFKVHTTRSGEHWALTTGGLIKISPAASATPLPQHTAILITEIKAGNDTVNHLAGRQDFSYKQSDIQFQWAAPSFKDEKQTRYSYRLEGSNADGWSEPSADAMVRFVNLAPGRYVLHVKAIFPNGLYPDTQTRYAFEILPPWWLSWWFKAITAAVCAVVILLLAKSYTRRKLRKQQLQWERQQAIEKERTRIAGDMHDDLGAGLSTIRFLSEKVKRNPHNEVAKHEIEKIAGISVELVENMNEIIWAMNEKNDTLEDLLFYTRSYAKEYCEEHHLQCEVDFPASVPHLFVSGELRRNVFLTVKESLHNVVKYAGAHAVHIGIDVTDHLAVSIRDDGRGFVPTGAVNASGGNGLRNMRRRIESIGGKFELVNGNGVTVTLEVPLQRVGQ